MGSTATVAVLFCDVVGSTARLTRLGDAVGDDFRRRLFGRLRECVDHTEGRVVKSLGDGLMVVFERSTIGAIDCAAKMHECAGSFDTSEFDDAVLDSTADAVAGGTEGAQSDPVQLRIGVSVGEVAEEDGDWFGTPVVEAARLCDAAAAGQTLAPALVESLVASRAARHTFRSVGALHLKGLRTPLSAVEVDRGRTGPTSPAPAVGASGGTATVERRPRWALIGATSIVVVALAVLVTALTRSEESPPPERTSGAVADEAITSPVGYTPEYVEVDCGPGVEASTPGASCGELVVPESRADPDGPTLAIPVVHVGASESEADPVVIIDVNEPIERTSLRSVADVYSLGHRGFTGADGRLTCPELATTWAATLRAASDDPSVVEQRADAVGECAGRLRAAGVQLEGYSAAEMALDVRDLALALDLGGVSVAAGQFTSTAAVAFARANPGLVTSLLLINPTPPGESALAEPARSVALSFSHLGDLCAEDELCAEKFGDLEARYELRALDLADDPVIVSTESLDGQGPFEVLVDERLLAAALEAGLQSADQVGLLPSALLGASNELIAAVGLNESVRDFIAPTARAGAYLSAICSYDAAANRTAEISDSQLPQFAGANDASLEPMCRNWDVPSVFDELRHPLDVDVPVFAAEGGLAVAGVNRWAAQVTEMAPDAVVLHFPTLSEDLAFSPPPCLRELRNRFVQDPATVGDTADCEKSSPEIDFVGAS